MEREGTWELFVGGPLLPRMRPAILASAYGEDLNIILGMDVVRDLKDEPRNGSITIHMRISLSNIYRKTHSLNGYKASRRPAEAAGPPYGMPLFCIASGVQTSIIRPLLRSLLVVGHEVAAQPPLSELAQGQARPTMELAASRGFIATFADIKAGFTCRPIDPAGPSFA